MSKSKKASIFDDITLFAKIAERLEENPPPSLRMIAAELDTTDYFLRNAIQRVQQHLGSVPLIHTTERMGSATALTDEGRRFFTEGIQRLVNWRPMARSEIRLAISHSLLTSRLLTSALAQFQATCDCQIDVRARVEMDFNHIIRDLQTDKCDAAVLWSTEQRAKENYPGVVMGEFNKQFDVVLIGTDSAEIERYSRAVAQSQDSMSVKDALKGLANKRVLTLRPDSQPAISLLPQPDRANGGERIELDTIDAVIASVEAKVADFGLVVANYDVLEPMRRAHQLFFTEHPLDSHACVLSLTSKRSNAVTRQLIRFIDKSLKGLPSRPSHAFGSPPCKSLPKGEQGKHFYERLKFGYYIDVPRGIEQDSDNQAPKWKWEEISLKLVGPGPGGLSENQEVRMAFTGRILNLFDDEFECKAELISENVFYVQGSYIKGRNQPASVGSFVSVFTWYQQSGSDGYIYGHWSGTDPYDNSPTIYSTIWSTRKMTLEEVKEITRFVRIRSVLSADEGLDFSKQPYASTMTVDD